MPTRFEIPFKQSVVSGVRFGNGPKLMIGVHGFADRATAFLPLSNALKDRYTVFCLDLPFHGETKWRGSDFGRSDLVQLIEHILSQTGHERFSLMGHSMGGRIALNLVPVFRDRIEGLYLFASAGLRSHLLLQRDWLPLMFRRWMRWRLIRLKKPPFWFYWLKSLRLMPRYAAGLLEVHFTTLRRRKRLLNTWVSMFGFEINPNRHARLIRRCRIPTYVYMGEQDTAVPVSDGEVFVQQVPGAKLRILPEGHNLITGTLCRALRADLDGPEKNPVSRHH
jgi:pimeloyl-ACP methyl ester carboxylesterase